MKDYDLVVIGSGPGGEKAAVKAAYFGYKVALVEKEFKVGGAGVHTGTLPSKTLKETALHLSGKIDAGIYGVDRALERTASIKDFLYRKDVVASSVSSDVRSNLKDHKIDLYHGVGSFKDRKILHVKGDRELELQADHFLIATGSYPYHPPEIPFDGIRVHDSDSILNLKKFPESICIVGAGVIGCEYATIFATMGVRVYLINHSNKILSFLDNEISSALVHQMKAEDVEIIFDNSVRNITVLENPEHPVVIQLSNEERLHVDMFLYAAGRRGCTRGLNLQSVGVEVTSREAIKVDSHYRTTAENIFAIGDCIGFPALASTSMDQGRVAVANMFGIGDMASLPEVFPYAIYTVPEVSCVGITEEEAKERGLDFCCGRASFSDMPRGRIMGLKNGFIKVLFSREDLVIQGIHMIGHAASELIHYGVTLVENKKTLHQVISTIFNYPTLHDLYKYACYDGLGNLTGHKVKELKNCL